MSISNLILHVLGKKDGDVAHVYYDIYRHEDSEHRGLLEALWSWVESNPGLKKAKVIIMGDE